VDPRMRTICARLKEGASYKMIATEFSISIRRVGQIRSYAGIERRRQAEITSPIRTAHQGTSTA
jgi:hypothetical protein